MIKSLEVENKRAENNTANKHVHQLNRLNHLNGSNHESRLNPSKEDNIDNTIANKHAHRLNHLNR